VVGAKVREVKDALIRGEVKNSKPFLLGWTRDLRGEETRLPGHWICLILCCGGKAR